MAEDKKPAKKPSTKKKKEDVIEDVPALPQQTITLDQVETVVEVKEDGQEEVINQVEEETEAVDPVVEAAAAGLEEVLQLPVKEELSKQAAGWRDWLAYQRMTPEDFLERYPSHKMRHLIQEIIDFNAKKKIS